MAIKSIIGISRDYQIVHQLALDLGYLSKYHLSEKRPIIYCAYILTFEAKILHPPKSLKQKDASYFRVLSTEVDQNIGYYRFIFK